MYLALMWVHPCVEPLVDMKVKTLSSARGATHSSVGVGVAVVSGRDDGGGGADAFGFAAEADDTHDKVDEGAVATVTSTRTRSSWQ